MPRWKIRLFSHVGLLSGPRAKIRTPCHQPPPPPSKSNFLYSLSHPPPLSSPLPTPLTFLTTVLRASAGGRAPAVGCKGGSAPPPPPSGVTAVGASNWQWGLLRRLGFRLFLFFLDIFAEIIFTWVGLGDSVKISFSYADALPARENDNLCGHLDADGTKVCM